MLLNRRQFLQASGLALCAASMPSMVRAEGGKQVLPIPPLLEPKRGQPVFLTVQETHWAFTGGRKSPAWGVNGFYLGPTVKVKTGDDVKVVYTNRLNEPVAMTVSGLLVPGPLVGGAARMLSAGSDWSPVLPIRQRAATCWYHANTPNRMASHIYNGLAGMWIIEDNDSSQWALPNHYAVDDFPVIIQDKRFNGLGEIEYTPPPTGGFLGNTLLVNGVESPYVEVSRGWVRLRLLNASNARRYTLRLNTGEPLHLIASDQGYLAAPVSVNQVSLAPGERREVLIDMTKGEEAVLTAGESAGWMERVKSLFESSDVLLNTDVLTLRPTGLLPLVTDSLPRALLTERDAIDPPIRSREFRLGDETPGINGVLWDMSRIDLKAQQGTWERWKIQADRPQSFHIEGASFYIRKVNGVPPLAEDQGLKDTVWVDGEVELNVYFNQYTLPHFPFIYCSQTLEMADRGSIGQMEVMPVIT